MSNLQPKLTRPAVKLKSESCTQEKKNKTKQSMEISSEWAQMLDFAGKVFKAAIVHMFKELKKK